MVDTQDPTPVPPKLTMMDLTGYRTIISLVVSMVLKLLVIKGTLTAATPEQVNLVTDALLLGLSVLADLSGVWFKLYARAPGPLSPEGKAMALAAEKAEPVSPPPVNPLPPTTGEGKPNARS